MREIDIHKTINECFLNIRNGANIKQFTPANGIPITRIETLSNDIFNRERVGYANIFDYSRYSDYILEDGDILMSHINSVKYLGRAVKYEKQGGEIIIHGMNLLRLVPNRKLIIPSFAEYYFKSFFFKKQIARITKKAVNQASFTTTDLKRLSIPVPPIAEQERIVGELDLLSGIIDKQKAQLHELDTLAQSIFYDMFGDPITNDKGWKVKKIKEIFSVKIGPFGSLLHNSDYVTGGTPLVNPIHMQNEKICPDFDFTVSDAKLKELGNYILQTNDIILARRGDIGRCAIVREKENGYLCGTGSLYIRPSSPIDTIFMLKMIRCKSMLEYLTSLAKGATMLNINCRIIEGIDIIVPPLELQNTFAEKFENIERQKNTVTRSIAETQKLFDYTMDKYFG